MLSSADVFAQYSILGAAVLLLVLGSLASRFVRFLGGDA